MGGRLTALTLCPFGLLARDDGVRDGDAMIETPENGYRYPLGPKVEEPPIPVGYIELQKAVEMLGQDMFPGEWTGEEREIIECNGYGQEFRSKVEIETDKDFRDAALMAQCELECEAYGGDPKLQYEIRRNVTENPKLYVDMKALLPLSAETLKEIEARFTDKFDLATAVRERREKVEDTFLHEMLWSGLLSAFYVDLAGKIIEIEPHIWGSAEGQNAFKYNWKEIPTYFGGTSKRPILIHETAIATALNSIPLISDDKKLLEKMETLLKTDPKLRSINAASLAVADEAVGATWESKAKRLARKYTDAGKYNPRD